MLETKTSSQRTIASFWSLSVGLIGLLTGCRGRQSSSYALDKVVKLFFQRISMTHWGTYHTILLKKSQRGSLQKLLNISGSQGNPPPQPEVKECPINKKQVEETDYSPKSLLYYFVQELVYDAGITGERNITARAGQKLQRLILACVDVAAKELLHSALAKYTLGKEMGFESTANAKQQILSPERIASQSGVLVTPSCTSTIATVDADLLTKERLKYWLMMRMMMS
jgi:hypothetical protein